MEQSKQPLIFSKIANIMNEVEAISKNHQNTQQKYQFRGIDDCYNALHPIFKKHRVFVTSEVLDEKREERDSVKTESKRIYSILTIRFRYYAEDGSYVESVMKGEAMDSGDKATNKAMSAAQKYSLIQMFLIPTQEGTPEGDADDKGDAGELEKLKQNILLFTEYDRLASWANGLKDWHRNREFISAVQKQLQVLKNTAPAKAETK